MPFRISREQRLQEGHVEVFECTENREKMSCRAKKKFKRQGSDETRNLTLHKVSGLGKKDGTKRSSCLSQVSARIFHDSYAWTIFILLLCTAFTHHLVHYLELNLLKCTKSNGTGSAKRGQARHFYYHMVGFMLDGLPPQIFSSEMP